MVTQSLIARPLSDLQKSILARQKTQARFWSKAQKTAGCWNWLGRLNHGYGTFVLAGEARRFNRRPHRIAYGYLRQEVPAHMTIDHLCRNRGCVNPAHMEVVTMGANNMRGNSPSSLNKKKTACRHGQLFTEDNTYAEKGKPNERVCRTCKR